MATLVKSASLHRDRLYPPHFSSSAQFNRYLQSALWIVFLFWLYFYSDCILFYSKFITSAFNVHRQHNTPNKNIIKFYCRSIYLLGDTAVSLSVCATAIGLCFFSAFARFESIANLNASLLNFNIYYEILPKNLLWLI